LLLSRVWKGFLILLGSLILLGLFLFLLPYKGLEDVQKSHYSLSIKDVKGRELYSTPLDNGLIRYRVREYSIPKEVKSIVLLNEDRYFYYHLGVNPISIFKTLFLNKKEGRVVSGASTISMQLARIITPRSKSLKSKALEMFDALRLELKLSKSEILSLYLSYIPFGKNIEGYGAASKYYYGKEFSDLTIYEASILAVIPRSPSYYDPIKNRSNLKEALIRNSDIPIEKFDKALDLIDSRSRLPKNPIKAPHFVNFVMDRITEDAYIEGVDIVTTLDLDIQMDAEYILNQHIENSLEHRLSNGAVLLIYKGDIVAYIGSKDFFDNETQGQIDGVQIRRQPGSTLKPFLYELAFESGFTPATIIPDIPTVFGREEVYRPENFSQTYNGPVRVRTALASSLNIPAVYLLERLGVDPFIKRLKELGFNSLNGQEDILGLGLAVGNAEVTLYELIRAFRSFKNSGNYQDLNWIKGDVKENYPIMDPIYASLTRDILSDKRARVLGFGRNTLLNTAYPSYFKTGTSNQFTNIWALGGTPDLSCGVWMGNFSGNSVIGTPGSSIPARIIIDLFDELSSKEEFQPLYGLEKAKICSLSGGLATVNCPDTTYEYFKDISNLKKCDYHKDGGGVVLPGEYLQWSSIYNYDNVSTISDIEVSILSPQDGAEFYYSPEIPEGSQGVEFQINGKGKFNIIGKGEEIISGTLPYQGIIYLDKGEWELEFRFENKIVLRYIKVS